MSIRWHLGNWIARHNQLLRFPSNGQPLERSQVAHISRPKYNFFVTQRGAPCLAVFESSGDFRFITCSCYQRQPFLGTAPRRDLFLKVLEQVRRRYPVVIVGYVVMPEHFHLPISEPQRGTPSTVLQALKLGFTRRVLGEWKRRGTSQRA